ncbi:hypothetical protein [Chryseobacterium sp. MMS23-Vi53]|uniref:hypothetical protein n=1 Tax=Chryseobacterium sp. MMS23-Vi53 TaxID=3386644 RepID=UPI0039E7EF8C
MKKMFVTAILLIGCKAFGQVGMNTPNPRGALDINKNTTNDMGLVLPTNTDVSNITNPQDLTIIPGTTIYDKTKDCVRFYKKTQIWSDCIRFTPTPIALKKNEASTLKNATKK